MLDMELDHQSRATTSMPVNVHYNHLLRTAARAVKPSSDWNNGAMSTQA